MMVVDLTTLKAPKLICVTRNDRLNNIIEIHKRHYKKIE